MRFQFGIDHLLDSKNLINRLKHANCALVAHPASVTTGLIHSLDALMAKGCRIICAFGPQHGMRGDKQDNMIESEDYLDPTHSIPMISLYGKYREPTDAMLANLDIVLFDLQDVGCRIYTYITTLKYFMAACERQGVELWILDRPNPAGRPIDGLRLTQGEESFVGSGPLPTRHGLTVGEIGQWFKQRYQFDLMLKVIAMKQFQPQLAPGYGWPGEIAWVNPSPNASCVNMARCFAGTVLLEGTTLSEGRGTSIPLQIVGAPELPIKAMLDLLQQEAPDWLQGANLRSCFFEPTVHKHQGKLCSGLQIHTDTLHYNHMQFTPYRLVAGLLKALRLLKPSYAVWRYHHYEYETTRIPIDVISGGSRLRHWVDHETETFTTLEMEIKTQLAAWDDERQPFLMY